MRKRIFLSAYELTEVFSNKRLICLCLVLFFIARTNAQGKLKPEIINYPKNVYGAESQNWAVTQDENNIFYIANNKGLLTYDGEEWNFYGLPKQKIIRSAAADRKGKIYTGAFAEFGYWQRTMNGSLQYHSLNSLIADSLFKSEEIWRILVLPDEVLFQSFSRIYLLRNNKVKTIVAPGTVMFTFPVRNKLYADVLGKGIYTIDDNDNFVPAASDKTIGNYKVTFILPYGDKEMLIGTDKNGMYIFDGIAYRPFMTEDNGLFTADEINNGVQINDDLYAIGTISDGVVFVNTEGKIEAQANRNSGLQNNTILNIFKAADGNCWVTLDRGVSQLVLNSDVQYFRDLQGKIGTVYSFAVYKGYLYVATNLGLYYAPFSSLSSFNENSLKRFGSIANQVWDLKVIDDKLFCSFNSGTVEISDNNTSKLLMDSTGCWDMEAVPGKPDVLLQGTYYGIAVYKKIDGDWRFLHFMSGTENIVINKLRVDAETGLIWVNHIYRGLFAIKPSEDYAKAEEIKDISKAKNASQNVPLSFFNNGNKIFVNGKSGIYKYDYAHNSVIQADSFKNVFGSYFYTQTIIPDSTKGYWFINKENEITYRNSRTGSSRTFGFNSNIFELVTGFENIVPFGAEQNFISGEEGFAVIDRGRNEENVFSRAPMITKIQVDDDGKYLLPDSSYFDGKDRIVLPHNRNGLLLHFSAITYDKNTEYSYSLTSGDQPEWSEWTKTAMKDFSNLSAGKYIFKVKSNLSEDVATLYIYVDNPWYWSILAKIIYVILFTAIIYILIKWHKNRLAAQQLQLTKKMKQEISLQRQKNENEMLLLKQTQLSEEVVHKSEDLAKLAMDLIKKKNVLKKLKQNLDSLKTDNGHEEVHAHIQKISKSLDKHLKDEENEWHLFDNGFSKVHEDFFDKLLKKYPELTAQDLRLAAYLKMNLSTKEIAPLLNISTRGVEIKRYRLRKKLNLHEQDNLNDFMIKF